MIEIQLTVVYHEEPARYHSANKTVNLPAVPRVGDYLSLDDLEDELPVTEVHFDLYGGVGIVLEVQEPEDLKTLLSRGWAKGL